MTPDALNPVAGLDEFLRVRECEGCLCTHGKCNECGEQGWLMRVRTGEDDWQLFCVSCHCPCCTDTAPRIAAHPHCPRHGDCRGETCTHCGEGPDHCPGYTQDRSSGAWVHV